MALKSSTGHSGGSASNDRFWLDDQETQRPGDTPGFFVPKLATETFPTETHILTFLVQLLVEGKGKL